MIRRIKEEVRPPNIIGLGITLAVMVLGIVGLNRLVAREQRKK